jgi:hypothetical protein
LQRARKPEFGQAPSELHPFGVMTQAETKHRFPAT